MRPYHPHNQPYKGPFKAVVGYNSPAWDGHFFPQAACAHCGFERSEVKEAWLELLALRPAPLSSARRAHSVAQLALPTSSVQRKHGSGVFFSAHFLGAVGWLRFVQRVRALVPCA